MLLFLLITNQKGAVSTGERFWRDSKKQFLSNMQSTPVRISVGVETRRKSNIYLVEISLLKK